MDAESILLADCQQEAEAAAKNGIDDAEADIGHPKSESCTYSNSSENAGAGQSATSDAVDGSPTPLSPEDQDLERIFSEVAASPGAFFQSQQRDEPDLSASAKLSIVRHLFSEQPRKFLTRYAPLLDAADLSRHFSAADAADFLASAKDRRATTVRNRRFAALRDLVDRQDEYFDDWHMRARAPLLYDQMVGRHLTSQEQMAAFYSGEHGRQSLSGLFLDLCESKQTADRRNDELLCERTAHLQPSAADDDDGGGGDDGGGSSSDETDPISDSAPKEAVSAEEKCRLREEFISEMHERFLAGADADWYDYTSVDDNGAFDALDLIGADREDAYFDAESPSA